MVADVLPCCVACCLLVATPCSVGAEQWALLAGGGPAVEIFVDTESVRAVDIGVFEVRLLYDRLAVPPRDEVDGGVGISRNRRIDVIRIRCQDMSYEIVESWLGDAFGNWRQPRLSEYRHPPGWRYGIEPQTAPAAARDLVCATLPP
jgi:hypothetical protein